VTISSRLDRGLEHIAQEMKDVEPSNDLDEDWARRGKLRQSTNGSVKASHGCKPIGAHWKQAGISGSSDGPMKTHGPWRQLTA